MIREESKKELVEFKKKMEESWVKEFEKVKRNHYCFICSKLAKYYCCFWRRYCSEDCQRKSDHYDNHKKLFKCKNTKAVDKRCLLKTAPPMPKLKFPTYEDIEC